MMVCGFRVSTLAKSDLCAPSLGRIHREGGTGFAQMIAKHAPTTELRCYVILAPQMICRGRSPQTALMVIYLMNRRTLLRSVIPIRSNVLRD